MMANVDARLAHETAHAWFPHVAKVRDPEDFWISESFSEHLSTVCLAPVTWYELSRGPRTPEQLAVARSLFGAEGVVAFSESLADTAAEISDGRLPIG